MNRAGAGACARESAAIFACIAGMPAELRPRVGMRRGKCCDFPRKGRAPAESRRRLRLVGSAFARAQDCVTATFYAKRGAAQPCLPLLSPRACGICPGAVNYGFLADRRGVRGVVAGFAVESHGNLVAMRPPKQGVFAFLAPPVWEGVGENWRQVSPELTEKAGRSRIFSLFFPAASLRLSSVARPMSAGLTSPGTAQGEPGGPLAG